MPASTAFALIFSIRTQFGTNPAGHTCIWPEGEERGVAAEAEAAEAEAEDDEDAGTSVSAVAAVAR